MTRFPGWDPLATISYAKLPPEVVTDESHYHEAMKRDALWMKQFQGELRALRRQRMN